MNLGTWGRLHTPAVCCGACYTPVMGLILSGASPVYETGSLKEVGTPNCRSD